MFLQICRLLCPPIIIYPEQRPSVGLVFYKETRRNTPLPSVYLCETLSTSFQCPQTAVGPTHEPEQGNLVLFRFGSELFVRILFLFLSWVCQKTTDDTQAESNRKVKCVPFGSLDPH